MISRFIKILTGKRGTGRNYGEDDLAFDERDIGMRTGKSTNSTEDDIFNALTWIEADASPFGIRILDCRPTALGLTAVTRNPAIATLFLELRNSDGGGLQDSEPEAPVTIDCDLKYEYEGDVAEAGALFRAAEMEDKWDISVYGKRLYFQRSWTGRLIFVAYFTQENGNVRIRSVKAASKSINATRSDAVGMVDFLIRSHLFGQECPHPIPHDIPEDERLIALYSFSEYGRWGTFAAHVKEYKHDGN